MGEFLKHLRIRSKIENPPSMMIVRIDGSSGKIFGQNRYLNGQTILGEGLVELKAESAYPIEKDENSLESGTGIMYRPVLPGDDPRIECLANENFFGDSKCWTPFQRSLFEISMEQLSRKIKR